MDNVDLLCVTIKLIVKKQNKEDNKKTKNIYKIFDELRDEEYKKYQIKNIL